MTNNNMPEYILNELPVAVYMLDSQNRLQYFNPAFSKLFGAGPEAAGQYIGLALACGFEANGAEGNGVHCRHCSFSKIYRQVRKSGQAVHHQKVVLQQSGPKNGIFLLEISVFPLKDKQIVVFVTDKSSDMPLTD
ncbi:MAG TPA: PAS domain-containing protein [Lentimicrobium sp.]|nr:PAS domain-containing protein [Lentimicrobium sp.]